MPNGINLSGQLIGRLTVIDQAENRGSERAWHCRCECGRDVVVRAQSLRSGRTRSCGCLKRERTAALRRTHGHTVNGESPTFQTWRGMLERCTNPSHVRADRYFGRGIIVCDRWREFGNFLADMGERPAGMSLDRFPDNDGNYEPGNCRWATARQQSRNRAYCKLTPDLAREIHGRHEHGESKASIARRLRIGETTVTRVLNGTTWRDVYAEAT